MDVGVVRSFYINDVQSVWSVTSCDKASDMISGVPLLHLESMSDQDLSALVNRANALC
jgi:hypothetical protein